jgi:NAD(P)-dependent dehydrogenase (short-subunit alcohol dehydrogenase family)
MEALAGKTAFVTGGGSGVGLGIATAFLGAGMRVVLADVRRDHLDEAVAVLAAGDRVHAVQLDVTDRDAMAAAADEAERVFGAVDVLCNNAGVNLFNDIADATYQDWDWMLGVNLGGVVNGVVTFVPRMKRRGEGGHVVNTGSMSSFLASERAGLYVTAKFAVRGLSESLRMTLAPHGIGVTLLAPANVNSRIYEADRTRPSHLSTDITPPDPEFTGRLREIHSHGMDPLEVGERVLRAVRRNDPYVFTHVEFRDDLRASFDRILAEVPDEDVPAERLAAHKAFQAGRPPR